MVVWCVLGIPDGGRGGGGTASWPLVGRGARVVGDQRRALVRNARAFGPGGQWYGGVPLVPSDRLRRSGVVWLWPLVGRSTRVVGDRRRVLVRNARAFGPGGRWYGGVPLVPSDRLHRSGVVWLWPLVGRSAHVVGDQRHALVRNARAFGPGGRWCGGMPLVPSDRRRGRHGARLWPLAGRQPM